VEVYSDWEDVASSSRAFQVFGPATGKARLLTLIARPVAPEDDCIIMIMIIIISKKIPSNA